MPNPRSILIWTAAAVLSGQGHGEEPSFVNHVIPMMTKVGCNSGACHGALAGKGGFKLSLRGHYSDGHTEDVTHWCKFNSTEDLVATVDQEGMVRGAGYGEAAITILFSNQVATCRMVSPFATGVDPEIFKTAKPHNFIDDLV